MREGLSEAGLIIYFQKQISDPHVRKAIIEVEHQGLGIIRDGAGQPVDLQDAVLNGPSRNGASLGGAGQPPKTVGEACFPVSKPVLGFKWHGQSWSAACNLGWNQRLLEIAVPAGMREPDIAGAEGLAQVEQDGDLPKPVPIVIRAPRKIALTFALR